MTDLAAGLFSSFVLRAMTGHNRRRQPTPQRAVLAGPVGRKGPGPSPARDPAGIAPAADPAPVPSLEVHCG